MSPATPLPSLPSRPPWRLRARLLTPLAAGGTRYETDALVTVDAAGRLAAVASWPAGGMMEPVIDLRPLVLLPGMVDLHIHLPQVPAAGIGAGLDLLTWLERHIFERERRFRAPVAEQQVPEVLRAMAAAGTTSFLAYGAVWADSTDAAFRAAEAHGIRAAIGAVMMDRRSYDDETPPGERMDRALTDAETLIARWDGADDGRLRYAVTPRFAVSCTAELLRDSAALAARTGVLWQTHVSEDAGEMEAVRDLFPEARDYLDVYDRAGALGPRTILAHAIHCSEREVDRLVESGTRTAHCPVSNLFISSGVMPLVDRLEAGAITGLGSDVAGSPELSVFAQMRTGFYAANARRVALGDPRPAPDPLTFLRLGTYEGARALGQDALTGSIEPGREADLIAVDPRLTLPPGGEDTDDPLQLMGRLIFRERPGMVRAAWVRGRLLPSTEEAS
ncbi:MAG: amidohydrolase family protein [Chloroflexi bacterium]|nr:amidohydrolase family protein [Chloroflexota bacterium]